MTCSVVVIRPLPTSACDRLTRLEPFAIGAGERLKGIRELLRRHLLSGPRQQASAKRGEANPVDQTKIDLPRMFDNFVVQAAHGFIHHRKEQALMESVVRERTGG